ncbi:hypothetical protein [Sporosarcina sp. P2]|uniref:hypothetical protein n=1 Tax=Sporosarcina sp. P2 TaxID=2048251 RepID=UPI00117BB98A|nr:hypothetical protein [Sporosarcina sp. P2]
MTDFEYALICSIMLPIIAFMIGRLWEDADHQLGEECEEDENVPVGNRLYARNRFGLRDDI